MRAVLIASRASIDHADLPAGAILETTAPRLYPVVLELLALGVPFVLVGPRAEVLGQLLRARAARVSFQTAMKCTVTNCPGELEERRIRRTYGVGAELLVVDGVPAEVCDRCGDVLLSPATVQRLEVLRASRPRATATAAVIAFTG